MSKQDIGAAAEAARATGPSDLSRASASSQSGIPSADYFAHLHAVAAVAKAAGYVGRPFKLDPLS